jgi:photosynthetic reaction center cytochrome c subunit
VNCTYCHNTRSMAEWSVSPLARAIAWHGIRLARDLNKAYLEPLASIPLPPERLGPMGDVPKLNCATCHIGAYRPLLGQTMLKEYGALAEAKPQPQKTTPPAPSAASSTGAVVPPIVPAAPAAPGPKQ